MDSFLASGRVQYFPSCRASDDWKNTRQFASLAQNGKSWTCGPETKCVDATFSAVTIPSTSPPRYKIEAAAPPVVPINELAQLGRPDVEVNPPELYVVIGAG